MGLTKAVASKIVATVAADAECCRRINMGRASPGDNPTAANFGAFMPKILEGSQMAGAVRNIGLMLGGKGAGTQTFDDLCCAGIATQTVVVLQKAMKDGKLPEIRGASVSYRETGLAKIAHKATVVRTLDDRFYVFDWHATLNVKNPAINTEVAWSRGLPGILFVAFKSL